MSEAETHGGRTKAVVIVVVLAAVVAALAVGASLMTARSDSALRSAGGVETAQSLDWQPCPDDSNQQCAYLAVPKSWSDPSLGTFRMHVRRLPAQPVDGTRPIGSLVINTGGPSTPSTAFDMDRMFASVPELRRTFDLVWPDPRGTGRSEPILRTCPQFPTLEEQEPSTGPVDWQQVTAFRIAQQTPYGAGCYASAGVDGTLLGTNQVVRDFDALRAALGEEQINFLGYSYGTRVGTVYARTFPSRVRTMVLDGSVDPSGSVPGLAQTLATGDQVTARFIRASLSPGMEQVYDSVVTELDRQVVTVDGTPMTRWLFGWDLGYFAGGFPTAKAAGYIEQTICGVATAAALPTGPCQESVVPPASSDASPSPFSDIPPPMSVPAGPAEFSPAKALINCADLVGRPDAAAIAGWMPPAGTPDTPLPAAWQLAYTPMCAGYPDAWDPIGTIAAAGPTPSLLFVNGTADPATPLGGARATAANFPGARMVTLDTAQHGVFLHAGSSCVNTAVFEYLRSATPPAADISCPATAGR